MFLLIMIMFQARGRRREVVQRSHSSGAGTSSVSKRSPFLCNLSPFMFIFLAMYSYSCLETMSRPLFSGAGEYWERVCEAAEAVEQQVGEHHSKRWHKSPHTAAAGLWQSLCRSGSRIQSGWTCWRHFNPHTLRSFWVVGGIGKSRRWL